MFKMNKISESCIEVLQFVRTEQLKVYCTVQAIKVGGPATSFSVDTFLDLNQESCRVTI